MIMPTQKKSTLRLAQALILAVLLNLSGHMFLHLSDASIEHEGVHIGAHSEQKSIAAPAHQCSVCQDHQSLTIENALPQTIHFESQTLSENSWQQIQVKSFTASFNLTRGPPLS